MRETRGVIRPPYFDHVVPGGATYDLVTFMVGDRLEEACRARMAGSAPAGRTLRRRIGMAIVALGAAVGGRGTMPAASDTLRGAALSGPSRTTSLPGRP